MLSSYDPLILKIEKILTPRIGAVRSKLVKTIHFYCKLAEKNGIESYQGKTYMYSSYEFFSKKHYDGNVSISTIRKSIKYMQDAGIICSYWPANEHFKTSKRYRLNYDYIEFLCKNPQVASKLVPYTSKFRRQTGVVMRSGHREYPIFQPKLPESFFKLNDDHTDDYQDDQRKSESPRIPELRKIQNTLTEEIDNFSFQENHQNAHSLREWTPPRSAEALLGEVKKMIQEFYCQEKTESQEIDPKEIPDERINQDTHSLREWSPPRSAKASLGEDRKFSLKIPCKDGSFSEKEKTKDKDIVNDSVISRSNEPRHNQDIVNDSVISRSNEPRHNQDIVNDSVISRSNEPRHNQEIVNDSVISRSNEPRRRLFAIDYSDIPLPEGGDGEVILKLGIADELGFVSIGGSDSDSAAISPRPAKEERSKRRAQKRSESAEKVARASDMTEASIEFKKSRDTAKYKLSHKAKKKNDSIKEKLEFIASQWDSIWQVDYAPMGLHGIWVEGTRRLQGMAVGVEPTKAELGRWKVLLDLCIPDNVDPRLFLKFVMANWAKVQQSDWRFKSVVSPGISDFVTKEKYRILVKFYFDSLSSGLYSARVTEEFPASPLVLLTYFNQQSQAGKRVFQYNQPVWSDIMLECESNSINAYDYVDHCIERGLGEMEMLREETFAQYLSGEA